MLRRAGPWMVAFAMAVVITTKFHAHSPASIAAMVVAYAIVAGALMSAVCQVVFALFRTAHRTRAVRDLHQHSRGMLYFTGALAALGDAAADGRLIAAFGPNLSATVATASNMLAALIIAAFAMRFRRQIGQIIALRPYSFRQAHPTIVDLLRLIGEAWHLPVLAVVFASVLGTLFAAGQADVILQHAMASVALFVSALALTLLTGRSPKATHQTPRIRDRRRSAYLVRFSRFAVALTRVVIWFSFLEICSRIW